jgi:hypothetical protein
LITLYATSLEENKYLRRTDKGYKFDQRYDFEAAKESVIETYLLEAIELKGFESYNQWRAHYRDLLGVDEVMIAHYPAGSYRAEPHDFHLFLETNPQTPLNPVRPDRNRQLKIANKVFEMMLGEKDFLIRSGGFGLVTDLIKDTSIAARTLGMKLQAFAEALGKPNSTDRAPRLADLHKLLCLTVMLVLSKHLDPSPESSVIYLDSHVFLLKCTDFLVMAENSGVHLRKPEPYDKYLALKMTQKAIKALEEGDLFLTSAWIRSIPGLF